MMKKAIVVRAVTACTLLFIAITLTSCELDRTFTKRGILRVTTIQESVIPTTDRNGYFGVEFFLDRSMISSWNSYDRFVRLDLWSGWLDIYSENFRRGDYIDLRISSNRLSSSFRIVLAVDEINGVATVNSSDSAFFTYMSLITRVIAERNNCFVYIEGIMYDARGMVISSLPYDITLNLDLDLTVRD